MKQQITYEQMILELGDPALCQCPCKQQIKVEPKYYMKYKKDLQRLGINLKR